MTIVHQSNPDSDKFEMVNAMLALQLFERYIRRYRRTNRKYDDDLILKGDNTIFASPKTVYAKQRNAKWQQLFQEFYSKLQKAPFHGDCVAVTKSVDQYLNIADRLSRGDHGEAESLPEIVFRNESILSPLSEYEHINISDEQTEAHPYMLELENHLQLGPHFQPNIQRSLKNNECILIFTSALPSRCSGILVLPKQHLTCYYSIAWDDYLDLENESNETIALLNALVALNIFREHVQSYRKCYNMDNLFLMTDSDFCIRPDTVFFPRGNFRWRKLFCIAHDILKTEPFLGDWDWWESPLRYAYKDIGMVMSQFLCHDDNNPTDSELPELFRLASSTEDHKDIVAFFPGNNEINVSGLRFPLRTIFNNFQRILELSGITERMNVQKYLDRLQELI